MLPLYHAHRLSAPHHGLEIALEPWYRWTFSLLYHARQFSTSATHHQKPKNHGTERKTLPLYHGFRLPQPDIRNRFSQIHGTANQIHPLYHAHRLSVPRHYLEIALEPWYRWTFSLPIPCSRESRHSPSRKFVKKAWYRETLSFPFLSCTMLLVFSTASPATAGGKTARGRRKSDYDHAVWRHTGCGLRPTVWRSGGLQPYSAASNPKDFLKHISDALYIQGKFSSFVCDKQILAGINSGVAVFIQFPQAG